MRVFGIQARQKATEVMSKFKAIKSDTKIIEELTTLFPDKKNSNAGTILKHSILFVKNSNFE